MKEFRGAVVRPFLNGRMDAGVNFLVARGYSGQTTENFYPSEIQEVIGVRIPSYDINLQNLFRLQRFFMASMRRPRLDGLSQA